MAQRDPMAMSLQELKQHQDELQGELQANQTRWTDMKAAVDRYKESLRSIDMIENSEKGQKLLVPMTESLYVPGRIVDTQHVTVEIGTGFFVKRPIKDAKGYLDRQINNISQYMERVGMSILALQQNLNQIQQVMQAKVAQIRQQQDAAAES